MRVALLANPRSGSGEASEVAAGLRAENAVVEAFGPDAAERVLEWAPERIAVAGGDGSLGAAAAAAARAAVPLAVIPAGTANDFARAMGLPRDVSEATRLAATGRRTRRLDVGRMDELPFLNAASVGLPPAAARRAGGLKGALGAGAYAVGALRAAAGADPIDCRAACDESTVFDGRAWQVTVACSGAFGAGSELDADPGDGRLDLVAVEAGSRARLALRALGLRTGTLESQRGVGSWRCRRIELDVPPGTPFNVDGEVVEAGPATFTVEAGALELVVG